MQTIIGALIGAVATIIASVIVYKTKVNKIEETVIRIENADIKNRENSLLNHKEISKDHIDLSKDHNNLAMDHKDLLADIGLTNKTLDNMQNQMNDIRTDTAKTEARYDLLKNKKPEMSEVLAGIQQLYAELAKITNDNLICKQQIFELEKERNALLEELQQQKEQQVEKERLEKKEKEKKNHYFDNELER